MADGAWGRQPPFYPPVSSLYKRPRNDYDLPSSGMASGVDIRNYMVRDDNRAAQAGKDTETLGCAYDRYLQLMQASSYIPGEASSFSGASLGRAIPMGESSLMRPGYTAADFAPATMTRPVPATMTRPVRETAPLPSDASNTLYVEGLPHNCTKREVAHIFRPFVGYKEVRLVSKESKHRGGDPLILCFVDFVDAACAATALSALQGYKMDEDSPDSSYLRMQFSRHPGPRSGGGGGGPRGRR